MLLEVTYKSRNNCVIAKIPPPLVIENNTSKKIKMPPVISTTENTSFTLTEDFMKDYFEFMSNLNLMSSDYVNS